MKLMTFIDKIFKVRGDKLPVICIFGCKNIELITPAENGDEEQRLDCRSYSSDSILEQVLTQDRPNVIITIGNRSSYPNLIQAPFEIQKRWLHYDTLPNLDWLGISAYECYLKNIFNCDERGRIPLVTVFTPAYKSGEKIQRAFRSLRDQTYANWEWIIVDDSDDEKTFKMLSALARHDHRIEVFKSWEHSGIIGKVKNLACSLARGNILVELDHDDELTDYALDYVVQGFEQFPEAGFLYTDNAEIYEDGTSYTYRDGWAFGYGSYNDVEYHNRLYKSGSAGNINSKTIRHIASTPNHIRAWRKSFYESIGGHNRELHVADDFEIIVRTFLKTRMVRVPKLCYLQHIGNTAQCERIKEIHRHVRSIRHHYDRMIHERFLELGCEDFAWDERKGCSDYHIPNPQVETNAALIADVQRVR
jgi:glycosyltransferase involved in cell wall biosynthesis